MSRKVKLVEPATDETAGPVKVKRNGVNRLRKDVRKTALKLAKGDAKRVEVLGPDEAVVHNNPV